MKIDVLKVLKDFKSEDIIDSKGEALTFRDAVALAINNPEQDQTAEEKNKLFQIGIKLFSEKEVDFTVDQLTLIKEKVGKVYSPIVYGRVCQIIEGDKKELDTA